MGSQSKYKGKDLRYVKIIFDPVGDPPAAPVPLNYGFYTNIPDSYTALLGHIKITSKDTVPDKFVVGASSPKPRRAGIRETNRYVSSFVSKDKVDDVKKLGWRVTRSRVKRPFITAASALVKTVYVDIDGVKYGWNIPKVTETNAGSLAALGIKEVTASDADEIVFGAEFPRPPRASRFVAGSGDDGGKTITTYHDPSKTEATGWKLGRGGYYTKSQLIIQMIILPGHPDFDLALGAIPPDWEQVAARGEGITFVADAETGLLRAATVDECEEYLFGGEYDERLEAMGEDETYFDAFEDDEFNPVEEIYIDF